MGHGGFSVRDDGLAARVCSFLDLCFQFCKLRQNLWLARSSHHPLLWLYISFYIILLGAEINAELELQTAVDTTTGRPKPMGKRGAFVADHVAGGPQGDRRPSSPVTRDPTAAKPGGS